MASPETRPQLPEPSLSLEEIFTEIHDDLETVETIIRDKVESKLELVWLRRKQRPSVRSGDRVHPHGHARSR